MISSGTTRGRPRAVLGMDREYWKPLPLETLAFPGKCQFHQGRPRRQRIPIGGRRLNSRLISALSASGLRGEQLFAVPLSASAGPGLHGSAPVLEDIALKKLVAGCSFFFAF